MSLASGTTIIGGRLPPRALLPAPARTHAARHL